MVALKRVDPGRWSTIAHTWARQAIRRAVKAQARTIRYPEYLQAAGRTSRLLSEKLGRDATAEELAVPLGPRPAGLELARCC